MDKVQTMTVSYSINLVKTKLWQYQESFDDIIIRSHDQQLNLVKNKYLQKSVVLLQGWLIEIKIG